jgi:hypothetical protein
MSDCKHGIPSEWCSIELHGVGYDPHGLNKDDHLSHQLWPQLAPNFYPSDNGCPSQADFDAAARNRVEPELAPRPLATEFPKPETVGRPAWAKQYDFGGTRFLGFYENELKSLVGFGLDPEYAAIH